MTIPRVNVCVSERGGERDNNCDIFLPIYLLKLLFVKPFL